LKSILAVFLVIIFLIMFIEPARSYLNNILLKHQDNLREELKEKEIIGCAVGRNPKVENIQNTLKYDGFRPGPVDGRMGTQTRMAIRKFQESRGGGMKVTGRIDPATWLALNKKQELKKPVPDIISKTRLPSVEAAEAGRKLDVQDEIIGHRLRSKDRVEKIQTALKDAGFYKGGIDGKSGSKTRAAIKAFQKSKGLTADGVVGQKTWDALKEYFKN
jgi:peptidoglycan hydrolase-like protein with peptidoglycan-binding domain